MLGLATGDALGAPLEFQPPGTFMPVTDMTGGGTFGLKPGYWTDDTAMALCLAESLIECDGFNAADQMNKYLKWFRTGYNSSTGECFDIGHTTMQSLMRYEKTRNPFSGSGRADTAGNGSLMRLAPVPLFYAADPELAIRFSAESSRTTHACTEAVDACRYFAGLIIGALGNLPKETILSPLYSPIGDLWKQESLCPAIRNIAAGSFKDRQPPDIRGTGYVADTLETALWAFCRTESFEEGMLASVNLGDDADTTGAVYGQLAGAYYGVTAIPERWLDRLHKKDHIGSLAEKLLKHSRP